MKISRITLGVGQDEIAGALGIDVSKVSRIENGFISPSEREKEVIARILDADPEKLFSDN